MVQERKKLNDEDLKREKRINLRLNLKKLPFKITIDNFCSRYSEMYQHLKPLFKYKEGEYALKWCLATNKKMKIFLLIFEANEKGEGIYKENLSNQIPEYSYKTMAQIVDEGVSKRYFEKLNPRFQKKTDSKISNIRPSEDLIVEFVNWQIDVISTLESIKKIYN